MGSVAFSGLNSLNISDGQDGNDGRLWGKTIWWRVRVGAWIFCWSYFDAKHCPFWREGYVSNIGHDNLRHTCAIVMIYPSVWGDTKTHWNDSWANPQDCHWYVVYKCISSLVARFSGEVSNNNARQGFHGIPSRNMKSCLSKILNTQHDVLWFPCAVRSK